MPVQVSSFLIPRNGNLWYLLEDKFLKGGLRVCANATERAAIHVSSLKNGMLVMQLDDKLIYQLASDLTTWEIYSGLRGADGADGAAGAPGAPGTNGVDGLPGIQGEQGLPGIQGIPGEKGEKGDPGTGGTGGSALGAIFVTNVVAGNTSKTFVSNTVPVNRVVDTATVDTPTNTVITVQTEGGSDSYSPVVRIDVDPLNPSTTGTLATVILAGGANERLFSASATIDMSALAPGAGRQVHVWADNGATGVVLVTRAESGPVITSPVFGAYPGTQTALKSTDVINITGTVTNNAARVDAVSSIGVTNSGSYNTGTTGGVLGAIDSGGAGLRTFSIRITASSLSGAQSATLRAKNSLGTYGADVTTPTLVMNQSFPSVGAISVVYPATQSALKTSEVAQVSSTVTGHTSIAYTSSDGNMSISSAETYAASKSVTYNGIGYTDSGTNYTITATNAANGAVTTLSSLIRVAAAAPAAAITIAGNPVRLTSSVAGNTYSVTLTSTQNLSAAPSVSLESSAGSISAFSGSGKVWTAQLTIVDVSVRGGHVFSAAMNNQANVGGTTINSGSAYTIGGFSTRTLTLGAFEQVAQLPTTIGDPSKVLVVYSGSSTGLTYKAGDLANAIKGWSIVDATYDAGGTPRKYSGYTFNAVGPFVFLTDQDYCNSNTSGTLQIDISEAA